jgi:hypothetical protein
MDYCGFSPPVNSESTFCTSSGGMRLTRYLAMHCQEQKNSLGLFVVVTESH